VSWHEAKQYTAWLSRMTGKSYRLLSEVEWEYAARAMSTTDYYWGNDITRNGLPMANCDGCGGHVREKTAIVGTFPANAYGLHDVLGNVLEWVEDCYRPTFADTPSDGSPLRSSDCPFGVRRGGSWISDPARLRLSDRSRFAFDDRDNDLGFRVARTLSD
jgi:formylglycine-generating enzyme required for sulfatase activity